MKTKLIVKCPNCNQLVDWHQSPFRPFCCERCKLIDLGAWADESYAIPAAPVTKDESDDPDNLN